MRIVTGGGDDSRCMFHKGPPFERIVDGTGEELAHTRGAVNCVRYNNAGTVVASVGTDKSICFYDGKTMELLKKVKDAHGASIYACDWSSNDEYLLTCSGDGTTKMFKSVEGTLIHTWNVAKEQQLKSPDDNSKTPMGGMQMGCAFVQGDLPVSVGFNGKIAILPLPAALADTTADEKIQFLLGHQSSMSCCALDASSGSLIVGDSDGVLSSYDLASTNISRFESTELDDETLQNKVHKGAISSVTTLESRVYSVGWDDAVRISEGKSKVTSHIKLPAQPSSIAGGATIVAISTVDGIVLVRDRKIVSEVSGLSYKPLSLDISSDDKFVVAGGDDCKIHIFAIATDFAMEEINVIANGHLKPIHALCLSNNGTMLASADVRDVCIWSIPENKSEPWTPLIGKGRWCFHAQRITSLAWSLDDKVIASGGSDDSIFLWSLTKKMKRVHYPFSHRGGITGLCFLPKDGYVLCSVGVDSCINEWNVTANVAKTFG
mmetsp:Transcript_19345/g.29379  ORF Transcript_19345/g.29379 Transcript_19345/m.29379 type:complete len:491 (-) Transcript_19345:143-1615(-)